MYYLTRQTAFEASHYNRIPELSDAENLELFGAAANPNSHGHNYVLEVMVKGSVDVDDGMVINLGDLGRVVEERGDRQLRSQTPEPSTSRIRKESAIYNRRVRTSL